MNEKKCQNDKQKERSRTRGSDILGWVTCGGRQMHESELSISQNLQQNTKAGTGGHQNKTCLGPDLKNPTGGRKEERGNTGGGGAQRKKFKREGARSGAVVGVANGKTKSPDRKKYGGEESEAKSKHRGREKERGLPRTSSGGQVCP